MNKPKAITGKRSSAGLICRRIEGGGERVWRYADFGDFPPAAVAQALGRLARAGKIERLSKGLYYRSRGTAFGGSRPNPMALEALAAGRAAIFPAGVAAANVLGFSTQAGGRREIATTALSLPRKLMGQDTVIHTRRPGAWAELSEGEGALLDFLRRGGGLTELSAEDTIRRTLRLFAQGRCYAHLMKAARTEPPRVRALLGALGERLGKSARGWRQLKSGLHPLSRFDFGVYAALPNARAWQAKAQVEHEAV